VTPAIHVEEGQRGPTSAESKNRFGVWDTTNIGDFIPERWLVEKENGSVVCNPFAGPSHPFGAGPRGCLGKLHIFTLFLAGPGEIADKRTV
jgi:hypothetical protein